MTFLRTKSGTWLVFIGIIVLWIFIPLLSAFFSEDLASRGAFGDQFGSVTALFSGLAFAGLIMTLVYQIDALNSQKKELELTRESVRQQTEELKVSSRALSAQVEEMSQQRKEMQKMEEAQREQADHLEKQAFESTFFQLLKIWNERTDALQWDNNTFGRRYFTSIKGSFPPFNYLRGTSEKEIISIESEEFIQYVDDFFAKRSEQLSSYFLLLFNCVSFVEQSTFSPKEKQRYCNILRANLSPGEVTINLYNAISSKGTGLGVLAWRYNLFLHHKARLKKEHSAAWKSFEKKFATKTKRKSP